jgi:diguanylate cyclase (GGDEF)-like protein/PAS domain S-box-containing protein
MESREEIRFEGYFPALSRWYHIEATPLSDGGVAIWYRDITRRVERTAALNAAEERFRLAAQATQDVVFDWDSSSGKVEWHQTNDKSLGYKAEDLGQSIDWWYSRIHPDDRKRVSKEIDDVLQGSEPRFESEYRLQKADGFYAEVLVRGYIARDSLGQPSRMVGAIQDNTARNASDRALEERESRLSTVFGQAMVGILQSDADGVLTLANERFCQLLGRTESELRELSFADYTHPDDLVWNLPLHAAKRAKGEPFQIEKRYLRPDGSIVWCEVSVTFVLTEEGGISSSIAVVQDITDRKVAEQSLQESEILYRSVLEASADCIEIINTDGGLHLVNSSALDAMNLKSLDDVQGDEWIARWPEGARAELTSAFETALAGSTARLSTQSKPDLGTPRWWDVVVTPMLNANGEVSRILSIARDTTAQKETAGQLKWASEHDWLTELPNRRAFTDRLQSATIRAMASSSKLGLLLIDLDHFKHVNDTLGHTAGDHFLKIFAQRLEKTVGARGFVARLGGDEFAVLLEAEDGELDLASYGESILPELQIPIRFADREMSASASMGGAVFPDDAGSANELFDNADIALYALKASGRGGTSVFQGYMRNHAQVISSQLSLARNSVTGRSVEPFYQPKVNLETGEIVGFEALLRWRHGGRGLQQPDTVAEAFKDYELATKISALMQEKVFADVSEWISRKLPFGKVSINAAPVEFLRDDFAERMISRLDRYDIPADMIELEVTEHVFLDRSSRYVHRALEALNIKGVSIALDDFGTGYSSLSHLRDFPVDVVKIDRTFVEKIVCNSDILAIVTAVIGLAQNLNKSPVAEGVETEDQRMILRRAGCPFGQGYLFGRPVSSQSIATLLRNRERVSTARG